MGSKERRDLNSAAQAGKDEVREEASGNLKAAAGSGRREAKFQRQARRDDPPMRRPGGRSTSNNGYAQDITRPYATINPRRDERSLESIISGYGGKRSFSDLPYSDHIFNKVQQVYVFQPGSTNLAAVSSTTSNSPAITRLISQLNLIYSDMVQYIQDRKFIANYILASDAHWQSGIQNLCHFYAIGLGLRSLLDCPTENTELTAIRKAVKDSRVAIEDYIDMVHNIPIPKMIYDILKKWVGVHQRNKQGPVICVVPNNFTDSPVDFSVASNVVTFVTNISSGFDTEFGTGASADIKIIKDTLRLAYPTFQPEDMPLNADPEAFDGWKYQAWSIAVAAVLKGSAQVTTDRDATIFLGSPGVQYSENYASLWRPPIDCYNDGTHVIESHGMFTASSQTVGTTGYWYDASGTATAITGSEAGASTGITLTDPISWMFPWAGIAAFNDTEAQEQATTLLTPYVRYVGFLDAWVECTITALREAFASGLRV